MDNPLQNFMDDFKKKVAAATSVADPNVAAAIDASKAFVAAHPKVPTVELDAEGFAVEAKPLDTDGAGVCAEHPEPAEYQGIGNQFGVIEGESRSRLD